MHTNSKNLILQLSSIENSQFINVDKYAVLECIFSVKTNEDCQIF